MNRPIVQGGLLDQDADAIVNAWNRNTIPWRLLPRGVSGAIRQRAGPLSRAAFEPRRRIVPDCNGNAMHIAIVTAGGAGMFCGSCMHDNTWARALRRRGAEVTLIPTYTPIRVDEEDLSLPEVFLGGINLYLEHRWPFWRRLPRRMTHWLDAPGILNLATRFGVSGDAARLGPLTLAMLQGEAGPMRREIDELAAFLTRTLKPDAICFSNILLCGALRRIRDRFDGQIACVLQGDDIFLENLAEPHRTEVRERIRERARDFDRFLVHSAYYRDFMTDYLGLPVEKFRQLPLGIDLTGHDGQARAANRDPFTVGYFARICPEKGLHQLVESFRLLHDRYPNTRLRIGGYLGRRDRRYFRRLRKASRRLGSALEYVGSPASHAEKVEFLKSLDVLSVPTVYREPKGLYVLEALANGVPVVQPRHGAFPELIESTGGGILVEPGDAGELASALETLMRSPERRLELATSGFQKVRTLYHDDAMAEATLQLFGEPPLRVGAF